jgi:hypothetical protein
MEYRLPDEEEQKGNRDLQEKKVSLPQCTEAARDNIMKKFKIPKYKPRQKALPARPEQGQVSLGLSVGRALALCGSGQCSGHAALSGTDRFLLNLEARDVDHSRHQGLGCNWITLPACSNTLCCPALFLLWFSLIMRFRTVVSDLVLPLMKKS